MPRGAAAQAGVELNPSGSGEGWVSTDDRRSSEAGGLAFPVESDGDPGVGAGRAERRGVPAGCSRSGGRGAERIGAHAIRPANCTPRS